MGLKHVATAAIASGALAMPSVARADVAQVDWIKALVELDHYARSNSENASATSVPRRAASADDPTPQNMGNPWFGVAPTVTLVARDWATSTRLAGERLAFLDQVRLAASTRMVVGRLRLSSESRVTPFLQVGIGQWRIDRKYVPHLPYSMEVASQFGTGFEFRLTDRWQIATEATATSLLREDDTQQVPQAVLWSALVASRLEF